MFLLARILFLLNMTVFIYAYKKIRTQLQQPEGKILGGENAAAMSFPFVAKLYIGLEHNTVLCSGTYIRPTWILTAGHCLDINGVDKSPSVGLGNRVECVMRADKGGKQPRYQSVRSSNLFCHPKYFRNQTHILDNLGLVLLSRTFNLTKMVRMARLPIQPLNYGGQMVTIVGYGLSKVNLMTGEVAIPQQLQMLKMRVHSARFCKKLTQSEDLICIGNKGRIMCTGDSGGPMIYKKRVVGICSYGFGCTSEYGIYENVFHNKLWIVRMTGVLPALKRSGAFRSPIIKEMIVYSIVIIVCFLNLTLD